MVADGFEGTKVFAIVIYTSQYIHISNQINQFAFIYKCPKLLLLSYMFFNYNYNFALGLLLMI